MKIVKSKEEDDALTAAPVLFGAESQIGMVMEECGELLSALNKYRRGRASAEQVGEEVADVIVMMLQMSKMFGGDFFVQANINGKLQHLIELTEGQDIK
jgi:NTP pyrophosphatase (non-canonical NTP hydrolase)